MSCGWNNDLRACPGITAVQNAHRPEGFWPRKAYPGGFLDDDGVEAAESSRPPPTGSRLFESHRDCRSGSPWPPNRNGRRLRQTPHRSPDRLARRSLASFFVGSVNQCQAPSGLLTSEQNETRFDDSWNTTLVSSTQLGGLLQVSALDVRPVRTQFQCRSHPSKACRARAAAATERRRRQVGECCIDAPLPRRAARPPTRIRSEAQIGRNYSVRRSRGRQSAKWFLRLSFLRRLTSAPSLPRSALNPRGEPRT